MARFKDHQKALFLRKQGKSYSQIKKILGISKGTLSCWLKDYPLSKQRIKELRDDNEQRIEKFRETMRKKKERKLLKVYEEQKKIIFPFTKRDFFIASLFLYWGEGGKTRFNDISISNTDPSVLKFFINSLIKNFKISKKQLKISLHLYEDMNIEKEMKFWSQCLNIPISQFYKPYIKKTNKSNINHKGGFGHGTCNVQLNGTIFADKTLMGLKAISDYFLRKKI